MFDFFGKKKKEESESPKVWVQEGEQLFWVKCSHKNGYVKLTGSIESPTTALLSDIEHVNLPFCCGYGTLVFEAVLEYAKNKKLSHLHGNLSEVDADHKDRLFQFYEKFGFEITEYPEPQGMYFGRIDLYLHPDDPT